MRPEPPRRRPAPLRGAAARAERANLFGLTLGAGVSLTIAGVMCDAATLSLSAFGQTVRFHLVFVLWAVAAYSFVLATRSIWLPDHRLRAAGRNLWLTAGGVAVVLFIRAVIWGMTRR